MENSSPYPKRNFNDQCYIEITEVGKKLLIKEWGESHTITSLEVRKKRIENKDYYLFSIWEVAHYFGTVMYNGNNSLPISMTYYSREV